MLLEMELDLQHPQMPLAERHLLEFAFIEEKESFGSRVGTNPVPCYNGWRLWGLRRCGFGDQPRVRRALRQAAMIARFEDGPRGEPSKWAL